MQYLNHQVKMVGFLKEKKSKKNSKKNKNENETPDIDFSDSFSILNTDTFADFSDDFIGPRPSKKMIKMQYLNKLEENLVSTKEKLQEEIKPYESELTDINEQIEQLEKKRGTSQRYGPKKVLEINDEIEDLKAKQEKILNDPSYLELLQDIAKIDYYQTKMDDSKILVDYLNDDLELDYDSDYKVNDERLKSMHNKYTINANDSSLYFYEGYEKYNPLLIAQYAYTEAGDNKFEGSVRERDVMMNGSDIGAEYLKAYAYMTQDQRNMYNYLYDSEGFESAEKFLSALKNTTTWKEQAGAYEAREYIISLDFDVDNSKMTSQDFENLSTDYEVIDGKYVKKDLSNVVLKGESAKNILKTFDTGFSDGIDGWCDGIKNLFINGPEASKRSIDDYKNAGILGCLSQTKYFESYNIGQTAGNQFIPTMIGLASGGILGAAGAGSKIGATLLGASAAGNSKQEALRNGYTLEKSWTYGILSGLSEVGTEYFLGSIPGLSSVKGLPSKMASVIAKGGKYGAVLTKAVTWSTETLCEGSEEWLQEYIDAGLRATVLGEKINFDELNGQALEAFKIGCIMGGISNSPAGKLKQEIVYATVGGERIQINLSNEIEGISNRIETNSIENNVISATKKKNITTKLKDTNNVMGNINDVNLLEAQYNLSPSEFYQIINEVRTEKGDNSSKVSFNEFYNKLEEKNNIISAVDQEAKNRLVDTNDVSNLTDAEFLKKTYNLTDAEFNTIIKKAKLSNKTGEVPFTEFKKKLDELIDTEIVTSTELQQKINEGLKNKNDVSNTTDKAFLQQSHNLTDDEINSVITNARATNKSNKVSLEEFQKSLAELTEQRLIKNKNESTKINNIEKSINSIIDEAENIFEIKGEYARELKGILDKIKSVNPECLNKFFKELDGISDSKEKIRIVDALCKRINNGAIDIDKISDEDIMCIFNELEFNEGVSYEKIPADKIEYAADLWSEGYEPLRNFLINCMNNDIQTYACCSGHDIDILNCDKLHKPYIMFSLEDSNTIEYIKKICQDSYFKKICFRNLAGKITVAIYGDDFYNRSQFFSNLESHIDSKDIILSSKSDAIDSIIDYLNSTKNKDLSEVYGFEYDAARNTFDIFSDYGTNEIATKVALNDLQNFIGGSKELSDIGKKELADNSDTMKVEENNSDINLDIEKSINSIIDEAENIFEIKGEYARELKGILDKIKSVNPECLNKFFKKLDEISDNAEKIRIVDDLCKRINNGAIDIDKISDEDIMYIFNELEFNEGVSYEKIPADKIEYAADLWSEGYEPLRNFLINCMNNDIQTYACCSGHDIDILSKTKLCKPYIMFNLEDSNTIEYIKKICQDPYFKEIYFSRNKAKKITAIIKADDFYNRAQFFSNLESHIDSKDIILSSRSDAIDSIIDYLDSTKNKDSSEVYTFRYDAARNTFDIHRHNSRKTIATKVAVDDLQNFIGGSKELSDVRMKALADKSDLFNRSSNYVKQLILKAYQEGTIDINSMTEQDFDNYIKYIIENNIFKNNGNLELSDFIEEIQATENIYKEFSLDKIFQSLFDGKYGTDQGIFRDKDVREKMKPELMKEYNMSAFDTESLMEGIDSGVGACSYAAAANDIISYFRYRPNDFEKIFGFPLYTINSSGSYAINCARLLADMYIWFNTLENHGYLFYEYDKHKFEYTGLPFSRQNCVWIKTRDIKEWKHKPTIRDYLRSKRRYISCINEYCLWNKEAEAAWNLKFGNGVTLYIEKNNSNIRFIDMDSGETYISTFTWNEGDSHLVKVIGMTDTGFIVSTWGKRCLVLFEDLEKSKGFDVYTTEFLSYDNYT